MFNSKSALALFCILVLSAGLLVACGSSDSSDSGGSGERAAMFTNSTYVDDTKGDPGADVSLLEAFILLMGHKPSAFNGISADDINTAVGGMKTLIIPSQANGSLVAALDAPAKSALESYVSGGGTLVVYGDANHYDIALVNGIFGFTIQNTANYSAGTLDVLYNEAGASNSVFAGFDYDLPVAFSADTGWLASSLPSGISHVAYDSNLTLVGDPGFGAHVAQIDVGSGRIVYLGETSETQNFLNRVFGGRPDSFKDSYVATWDTGLQMDLYGPDGTTFLWSSSYSLAFRIGRGVNAYIKVTDTAASPRTYTIHTGWSCKAVPVSVCYVEDETPASDPDKYESNDTSSSATKLRNDWALNNYMSSGDTDWFAYQNRW